MPFRYLALIFLLVFMHCEQAYAFPGSGLPETKAETEIETIDSQRSEVETVPVVIDGHLLFNVAGVSAYPATRRAADIRRRLIEFANKDDFNPSDIVIEDHSDRSIMMVGSTRLMTVLSTDASLEGLERETLAGVYRARIAEVILDYREDREPARLGLSLGLAIAYLVVMIGLIWGIQRIFRWLNAVTKRHVKSSLKDIERKAHRLVHAGRMWLLVDALFRVVRWLLVVLIIYLAITSILNLFPWTRTLSENLLSLFLNPLRDMWQNIVDAMPGLVFILVLFLILHYLINVMRLFFRGVENGTIPLNSFEPDWAMPTFKIARIVVIALGVVIAYPYIPGSDSLAFKGISVFVGVLLSIGSSSVITNTFAGLSMIYRSAFKVGDRVQIGNVTGMVKEIKLQTTQIVTAKNETVVIPNSNIMNANVVNYSQLAREEGLILHTTVTIGYDTPRREVEAMLLEAADRTEQVLKDPAPFVLRTSLGDFSIEYELNAYSSTANGLPEIYSAMHDNILDVFNENQVQIMSPAYMADPEKPKVAPT